MHKIEVVQSVIAGLKEAAEQNKTPAFLFDRISDKPQESKSLEFQEAHSKRYVQESNLFAVYHFSVTESGWSSEERKKFKTMIELSQKFGIRDLVFKNTDRLSRNLEDLLRIQKLIEEKDYRIHFFENHHVIQKESNYNDKWTLELLILVAKRHSDKISHDMKASNKHKIEKRIAPGRARLGYLYDKEKRMHVIDPVKEPEVRWIFDEFDTGKYSLNEFVDLVNARGIHNLFGKKWQTSRLYDLLTSPFYHGEFYIKRDKSIHQGNHQAYYEKERYEKRRQFLTSRYYPRKDRHSFLLSGIVECTCDRRYFGDLKKRRFVYYSHPCLHLQGKHMRFNENTLFNRIDEQVSKITITDDFAEHLKNALKGRVKERNANTQEDLRFIANRIFSLGQKKSRLLDLYADEQISKTDLTGEIQRYDREIAQLRKQEKNLSGMQADFVIKVAEVIEDFKNFPRIYTLSTRENKARLLRDSMEKIVTDGSEINLHFKSGFKVLYKSELLALSQGVRVYTSVLPE